MSAIFKPMYIVSDEGDVTLARKLLRKISGLVTVELCPASKMYDNAPRFRDECHCEVQVIGNGKVEGNNAIRVVITGPYEISIKDTSKVDDVQFWNENGTAHLVVVMPDGDHVQFEVKSFEAEP